VDEHGYRRRIVDDELDVLLAALPAVAIEGAKAVGKTATATQRARVVFRLDEPTQREIVAADPDRVVEERGPILVDEWQLVPELWDRIRRAVDAGAPAGRFLLTGSASPVRTGTHTGGGRIVGIRLRPMSLAERIAEPTTVSLADLLSGGRPSVAGSSHVTLERYTDEIVRSGFPGIRLLDGRPLRAQLDGYLRRIVDRDFPELGHPVRNPSALRRWMAAYAAATATVASFEKVREAATGRGERRPSRVGVQPYRDVLERLFIIEPVPAWRPRSHIRELASPQKHHLVDPALAARLLGASMSSLLRGDAPGPHVPRDGTLLGALFESLVTQSIRVYAQASEAVVRHFRTHGGEHETDLIVERDDGRVVAVEVKLGALADERSVRHLRWLSERIGDELLDAVVVTTGSEAFRRPDGIAVVPAALLGP
jgi:predicted AAA+ superfamily ATPase